MNFADIDALMLDGSIKGIPIGIAGFPLGEIGGKGWNVLCEDLPLPLADGLAAESFSKQP
jgi:D-serine dehydratase